MSKSSLEQKAKILIVDDEASLREFLSILFRKAGYDVEVAESGDVGIQKVSQQEFDVVFTDLKMPGKTGGLEVLTHTREVSPATQVVVMTAFATTETAISALKMGAYDYVQKPFKIEEVEALVAKCLEKRALLKENVYLKSELLARYGFGNIIGKSAAMRQIFDLLRKVAATKVNVLIQGESGTGKELVARALHYNSPRTKNTFVAINCGAIPEQLLESELFGHMRGAFTGAEQDKPGLFQTADGGTLFLDELGELPLHTQVKLLRVLQDRMVRPLGSTKALPVDVRIVAATNKRLGDEVRAGRFREDLFFRLNVMAIEMPSLRERREDIPLLAKHFLRKITKEMEKDIHDFSRETMDLLLHYTYPGNVRELENIVERAVLLEGEATVQVGSLPPHIRGVTVPQVSEESQMTELPPEGLEPFIERIERQLLLRALRQADGVRKDAAKLLKISSRSFRYRLAKHDLQLDDEYD